MGDPFTIPGLGADATTIRSSLQGRLSALIDTALMLKHIHWNVVGPSFITDLSATPPRTANGVTTRWGATWSAST